MDWHLKGAVSAPKRDEVTGPHFTLTVLPVRPGGFVIEVHHYPTGGSYPFHPEVWQSATIHDVTILTAEVARLTHRLILGRDPL